MKDRINSRLRKATDIPNELKLKVASFDQEAIAPCNLHGYSDLVGERTLAIETCPPRQRGGKEAHAVPRQYNAQPVSCMVIPGSLHMVRPNCAQHCNSTLRLSTNERTPGGKRFERVLSIGS
jgi:hypothetical protein